jgi:hypothetical protein
MDEFLYRYESHNTSNGCDEFDNPYPGHTVELYCRKYRIVKKTPKGHRIELGIPMDIGGAGMPTKFILQNATKRFACPTKAEALDSFIARKKRYIRILGGHISDAEIAIRKAEVRKKTEESLK